MQTHTYNTTHHWMALQIIQLYIFKTHILILSFAGELRSASTTDLLFQ